jgi:hypothetical protein
MENATQNPLCNSQLYKKILEKAVLPGKSWPNPLHRTHYTVEVVLAQKCGPQGSSKTLS